MPRTHTRALSSAAFLVAALVGSAAPAVAGVDVHRDPAGDVVLGVEEGAPVPAAPDQRTADVVRVKTSYAGGVVRLAATTRAALPTRGQADLTWEVLTSAVRYQVAFLTPGMRATVDGPGDDDCAGLATTQHGATRVIVVPGECLGSPRWVRTGLYVDVRNTSGPGAYVDDARRAGLADPGAPILLGPKVRPS